MATKATNQQSTAPKRSKREKRQRFIIYLMIATMALTSLLAGAGMFIQ
ncbi:hypothetical protein N781_04295 [Pontibacillus halophilus JSM 076056 = DSM 19796]|uniref:Stressosome-associated protein Prli42 n=1 Tax=Pontibacillus halophilus JSM 076056 = DSM 19796 TaxID=1385510 RepID=A0A0A5GJK3_9BACI|nr:stressosome-associated protein Prli42 [Pontibacillus halophilus]KGX91393.1 hypothetical protein N781_04295 [Pontibacillus halophilus JSM 076056 = DSM 19796]